MVVLRKIQQSLASLPTKKELDHQVQRIEYSLKREVEDLRTQLTATDIWVNSTQATYDACIMGLEAALKQH